MSASLVRADRRVGVVGHQAAGVDPAVEQELGVWCQTVLVEIERLGVEAQRWRLSQKLPVREVDGEDEATTRNASGEHGHIALGKGVEHNLDAELELKQEGQLTHHGERDFFVIAALSPKPPVVDELLALPA
jgi:hypothetical protein